MRGCFVTGTDTGVGKTAVAGAIAAGLVARGERVAAFKPVVTGLDEPADPGWPHDHELLAATTGQSPEEVSPSRFGPPVSPHLAAELAGRALDTAALIRRARELSAGVDALVVEGVGGLLVPLAPDQSVRDLARDLALPVVVAARPGLGTINHALLTLEAARAVDLAVAAVVLTPWSGAPGAVEASNRATIAALGDVDVFGLPSIPAAEPAALATAAAELPLERWLSRSPSM